MATRRSTRKRGATTSAAASVDVSSSSSLELDNGGAAAATSKSKKSRRTPKRAVTWQWEEDGGKWTNYEASLGNQLTTALLKGDKDVTMQVATSVKLKVRFGTMTQMNVATGWQRNVRCVPSRGSREEKGKWEWQDEHGKWNIYAPPVQRLLRGCELCGVEETETEAHGRKYKVDLENKKQVNVDTGVERKIRHTSSATQDADMADNDDNDLAPSTSIPTATSATTVGATPTTVVGDDDEEEPKPKPGKKRSASSAKKIKKAAESSGASGRTATSGPTMVTNKGKVPVDYECKQKVGKAHVFCEGGEFWDAMLNQTNLKNNNNKFYILQLLEDNTSRRYSVWFRWGRVGKTGQHSLMECGTDLEGAKQHFTKKFFDKTVNSWDNRKSFVKHTGKYDLLLIDYETKEETDQGDGEGEPEEDVDGGEGGGVKKKKLIESKLDKRLQALIELICNVQNMEDAVVEMKYDVKRAPLGKLTTDQIRSGYAALKKIEDCITRNHFGDQLLEACDAFYTRIPHSFGMQRPPLIRTKEQVKEKLTLLEALSDIQIAMKVLDESKKHKEEEHPVDRHYKGLHCQLAPLEHEDKLFGLIEKYVKQTHAKTHNQYWMEVTDVFEMERNGEKEGFKDVGNRQLLWHGSRLTNWVGILSQGLRIAPPEAPVTGYMFGKGIYFADMCSKSANYCFASKLKNEGLLVLSEVALGQTHNLLAADYSADKLPAGKHSTKGLGRIAPDPTQNETLDGGVLVPLGSGKDTGVHNPHGYTLNYNEFVVYDVSQVKMRYLVKLKFHFK